jgi:ribulose-phosphate 3-epimerase
MKKMKIIPTVFAHNKAEFQKRFKIVLPLSKDIQIDFMDGKLVPAKSVSLSQIPNLKKYNKNFEAHLMVKNPQSLIKKLKRKGFRKILFHYEAYNNIEKSINLITKIKTLKLTPAITFNPSTSFNKVLEVKDHVKIIMFMGHAPGHEGLPLNPEVLKNIKALKKLSPKTKIQVDGAVNPKTIKKLKTAGADILNIGSYLSNSKDPRQALKKLKSSAK